jgi:signal peptidase I
MPIHAIQVQSTTTLNNPLRQPSFYICTLTHSNFSSDTSMILRQYQRLIVPLTRHRLAQLPRSNGNNKFLFCSKSTPRYGRETSKEAPLPEAADNIGMTTHIGRLVFAFGIVYVVTEFGLELTMCEGPSMLPTILHRGEIVLLDRATPRWFGLHHGTNGRERARLARALQKQRMGGKTIWYEPRIPVNQLPPEQAWDRFWQRVSTPVSVGDVVVVQHPDRVGTVCKRVLGLPGDIVTKPTTRRGAANVSPHQQRGHLVVPDGHM